jgi:uncharacterized coiled-coil protein SlyX
MTKEKINDQTNDEIRLAIVEHTIKTINDTLVRFEKRFDKLEDKMDSQFKWLLTIIAGLGFIMAHGFHWF